MLFRTPEIGSSEERVLGQIRDLWTDLRFNLQQRPRRWTGLLARSLRARAIQGSNRIEGYRVSQEDALAAIDGTEPEEADAVSWENVVHYREAMDYVLQLGGSSDFSYSKDLLRSLHFMMIRHDISANPGQWRPGLVLVKNAGTGEIVYEGPDREIVPSLIADLVRDLTAEDDQAPTRMIRAAMAHLNLVMIHPFSDGNGRMARCLQTLVLARGGLLDPTFSSIEEYLGRNILEYYTVLNTVGGGRWEPKRDALPWVRFCLTAHYRQAKSAQRRLDAIAVVGEDVDYRLKELGLPERAATSLVNAALGMKLRNSAYRNQAEVSMPVASRDLKMLVDAGLLVSEGEKRGRYYLAGEWLSSIAAAHRKPASAQSAAACNSRLEGSGAGIV